MTVEVSVVVSVVVVVGSVVVGVSVVVGAGACVAGPPGACVVAVGTSVVCAPEQCGGRVTLSFFAWAQSEFPGFPEFPEFPGAEYATEKNRHKQKKLVSSLISTRSTSRSDRGHW